MTRLLVAVTACAVVASGVPARAASLTAKGRIAADVTWSADTVFVDSSVTVDSAATLIIAPGTVVITEDEQTLTVKGRLLATGTAQDSIIFTTASTSIPWHGIRFANVNPAADSSRLDYCRVEEAEPDYNGIIGYWGGGITIKGFSRIAVTRSTIANNGGNGMYKGGGVHCDSASPLFAECLFYGNSINGADTRGAAMYLESASPRLVNCIFQENRLSASMGAGAGLACCVGSSPVLENCLFFRNASTGAVADGGAIVCEGSSPRIINCTVALNGSSSTSYYGQALLLRASSPQIVNTIFWGNRTLSILVNDTSSKPLFRNCLLDVALTPIGTTTNRSAIFQDTIMGDAAFVDTAANDFSLSALSRCINTGTADTQGLELPPVDLAGDSRIFNGVRIDIGAYEFQGVSAARRSVPAPATAVPKPARLALRSGKAAYSLNGQSIDRTRSPRTPAGRAVTGAQR